MQFIYPSESGLYPTHFFIALTTLIIFLIILIAKAQYGKNKVPDNKAGITNFLDPTSTDNTGNKKIALTDLISIGAAIITLIIFIATPFISQSLLDYQIKSINGTTIAVDILNSGIKEAKNVLISYNAQDMNFSDFTTHPHLLIKSIEGNKMMQQNNANFSLDSLPSRSFTTVFSKVNSDTNQETSLKVYLRTEDSVAYFNLVGIIVFYVTLSFTYGVSAYLFWFKPEYRTVTFFSCLALIGVILFMGPFLHDCSFTYRGCY